MTIRSRLFWLYGAIAAVVLIVSGFLAYQKFFVPSGDDINDPFDPWDDLSEMILWCMIPVSLASGWWVMRKTLAPILRLTEAVEKMHAHNLRITLPRSGNGDEVDRLSEVFNEMVARLDQSFQRIRDFTLYASHELKTPLTIMRGELEIALTDEGLPAALGSCLQSQLGEIRRLADIVDRLSLLTKADSDQIVLARDPVALDLMVREITDDAKILATAHDLQVELTACEPLTIIGDAGTLRQMLLNLIDNAIKYNHPGGHIRISLRQIETGSELAVSNTGPGLPAELQGRVFDRFFRGHPAHNVAGTGLGLSIVEWIVRSHKAEIRFASTSSETTLTVIFPHDTRHEQG